MPFVCHPMRAGPGRLLVRQLVLLLSALLLLAMPPSGRAMPILWRSHSFEYTAHNKPLREVLNDFGASQGMAVAIAKDVDGTVGGKFRLAPEQFLNLLALSYGFVWYYNGAVLNVVSAKGVRTTLIKLNASTVAQLQASLERIHALEPRFPIRFDEVANTALVAGPQEYVDLVRELAAHLESRSEKLGRAQTQSFPLRYGWAADREEGGVVQAGVATLLRNIYARNGAGDVSGATQRMLSSAGRGFGSRDAQARNALSPLLGNGAGSAGGPGGPLAPSMESVMADLFGGNASAAGMSSFKPTAESQAPGGTPPQTAPDSGLPDGLPVIVADAQNNAVVIRDLPERMAEHQRLIQSLDRRTPMIEIEVHIIDLADSALRDLGVDWSLSTANVNAIFGGGIANTAAAGAGGLLGQAILTRGGDVLLSRVSALESSGRARVSAKPKVTTMNGVRAVMDSQRTFYVKVAGVQTAQLFDVTAGTSLHVTPAVTYSGGRYRIKMDVQVEDGQILEQLVEGLPVVSRNRITTQAFVNQGQSLLLAGYSNQTDSYSQSGVPGLSSLPLVGGLFRHSLDKTSRSDRLYLLTPRVINLPPAAP
jgi:type III secretion protein C